MLVNSFDEHSLSQAVRQIGDLEAIDSEKIRQCSIDFFDLKSGVQKYLQVYLRMLQLAKEKTPVSHA
jgi:hypothetical protein